MAELFCAITVFPGSWTNMPRINGAKATLMDMQKDMRIDLDE